MEKIELTIRVTHAGVHILKSGVYVYIEVRRICEHKYNSESVFKFSERDVRRQEYACGVGILYVNENT